MSIIGKRFCIASCVLCWISGGITAMCQKKQQGQDRCHTMLVFQKRSQSIYSNESKTARPDLQGSLGFWYLGYRLKGPPKTVAPARAGLSHTCLVFLVTAVSIDLLFFVYSEMVSVLDRASILLMVFSFNFNHDSGGEKFLFTFALYL